MITEDYVSYETSQLLKSKGFDELCYACYEYFKSGVTMYSGWLFEYKGEPVHNTNDRVKCPTLQMAMKWLRNEKNIHIKVHCSGNRNYLVYAQSLVTAFPDFCIESATCSFNSSEEACEAAIKYCLENLI